MSALNRATLEMCKLCDSLGQILPFVGCSLCSMTSLHLFWPTKCMYGNLCDRAYYALISKLTPLSAKKELFAAKVRQSSVLCTLHMKFRVTLPELLYMTRSELPLFKGNVIGSSVAYICYMLPVSQLTENALASRVEISI
jgi:hypothetical protein